MRSYSFCNFYLSQIQQGIQAAHSLVAMSVKYKHNTPQHETYVDWAANHQTMIVLNGGNSLDIAEVYAKFMELEKFGRMDYPFARFHEDMQSLNGALTCVSIVLPEKVYNLASACRDCRVSPIDLVAGTVAIGPGGSSEPYNILGLTAADAAIADLIMNCRLA